MRPYECSFTVQARNENNCSIISYHHHHPPLTNPLKAITMEIPGTGCVWFPFRADTTGSGELAGTSGHEHGELNVLPRHNRGFLTYKQVKAS